MRRVDISKLGVRTGEDLPYEKMPPVTSPEELTKEFDPYKDLAMSPDTIQSKDSFGTTSIHQEPSAARVRFGRTRTSSMPSLRSTDRRSTVG